MNSHQVDGSNGYKEKFSGNPLESRRYLWVVLRSFGVVTAIEVGSFRCCVQRVNNAYSAATLTMQGQIEGEEKRRKAIQYFLKQLEEFLGSSDVVVGGVGCGF